MYKNSHLIFYGVFRKRTSKNIGHVGLTDGFGALTFFNNVFGSQGVTNLLDEQVPLNALSSYLEISFFGNTLNE